MSVSISYPRVPAGEVRQFKSPVLLYIDDQLVYDESVETTLLNEDILGRMFVTVAVKNTASPVAQEILSASWEDLPLDISCVEMKWNLGWSECKAQVTLYGPRLQNSAELKCWFDAASWNSPWSITDYYNAFSGLEKSMPFFNCWFDNDNTMMLVQVYSQTEDKDVIIWDKVNAWVAYVQKLHDQTIEQLNERA